MIRGILLAGLIVLVPLSASAQQTDAKALAQDILDRGTSSSTRRTRTRSPLPSRRVAVVFTVILTSAPSRLASASCSVAGTSGPTYFRHLA